MMRFRNPNGSTRVEFTSTWNIPLPSKDEIKLDTPEKALEWLNELFGDVEQEEVMS